MTENTTLDMINGLTEIAEFMEDEELTTALTMIAKLIIKPDIPAPVASIEIVRLQAIAGKLALKATWMANVDKNNRANLLLHQQLPISMDSAQGIGS
jgi:hypothetical protein